MTDSSEERGEIVPGRALQATSEKGRTTMNEQDIREMIKRTERKERREESTISREELEARARAREEEEQQNSVAQQIANMRAARQRQDTSTYYALLKDIVRNGGTEEKLVALEVAAQKIGMSDFNMKEQQHALQNFKRWQAAAAKEPAKDKQLHELQNKIEQARKKSAAIEEDIRGLEEQAKCAYGEVKAARDAAMKVSALQSKWPELLTEE